MTCVGKSFIEIDLRSQYPSAGSVHWATSHVVDQRDTGIHLPGVGQDIP